MNILNVEYKVQTKQTFIPLYSIFDKTAFCLGKKQGMLVLTMNVVALGTVE